MELNVPGCLQYCNSIYEHVESSAVPDAGILLEKASDIPAGAWLQVTQNGQTYLVQDGEIYKFSHKISPGVDWSRKP